MEAAPTDGTASPPTDAVAIPPRPGPSLMSRYDRRLEIAIVEWEGVCLSMGNCYVSLVRFSCNWCFLGLARVAATRWVQKTRQVARGSAEFDLWPTECSRWRRWVGWWATGRRITSSWDPSAQLGWCTRCRTWSRRKRRGAGRGKWGRERRRAGMTHIYCLLQLFCFIWWSE